jgi:hypothetical protein
MRPRDLDGPDGLNTALSCGGPSAGKWSIALFTRASGLVPDG